MIGSYPLLLRFFFFNDTATTEIYTLSLHDALPILRAGGRLVARQLQPRRPGEVRRRLQRVLGDVDQHRSRPPGGREVDRKSTRLNSSHANISYAVFCLKKKKNKKSHLTVLLTLDDM